jgi:hypothetical protein
VPLLTPQNYDSVVTRATHRSKREIEQLVAELTPRPDVPSRMRKLPERRRGPELPVAQAVDPPSSAQLFPGRVGTEAPPVAGVATAVFPAADASASPLSPVARPRPPVVAVLSPARYKVQFTASAELHDKLERLQALMRSQVNGGDLAAIIELAVTETLQRLEGRRFARTAAPRKKLPETDMSPASRHIPAAVRRAVRERDQDRCRFVDELGRRCPERHRLEFHHRHPFGMRGDHSPGNISLMCAAHNRYLAECDYGRPAIRRHLRMEKAPPGPPPNRV